MRKSGEGIVIGQAQYIIVRALTADRGDGVSFYEALDPSLGRKVGLKEIRGGREVLAAADKEIQAIVRLNHQRIPPVLQRHRIGNSVFLVMQYLEGPTLREYIAKAGPARLPSAYRAALRLMVDLCRLLQDVHRHNYFHRDLNPNNIIIRGGRCHLIDFGVTVAPRRVQEGTKGYAAPEQERPRGLRRALGATVDTFAVGLMTMELLTDALPALRKHPRRDEWRNPHRPTELNQLLPPEVDEVVLKAISYLPENRYRDARSLRLALERLLRLNLRQGTASVDD